MILSYLLTLLGVCGLAVGSLVVLRAAKGGGLALGSGQPIRVVARQSLGTGAQLMLLDVEGERLLVSVSRAGVQLHSHRRTREDDAQPSNVTTLRQAPDSGSFSAILRCAGARG